MENSTPPNSLSNATSTKSALKRSLSTSKPTVAAKKSCVKHANGTEVEDEYLADDERSDTKNSNDKEPDLFSHSKKMVKRIGSRFDAIASDDAATASKPETGDEESAVEVPIKKSPAVEANNCSNGTPSPGPDGFTRWSAAWKKKQERRAKKKAKKNTPFKKAKARYQPPAEFESASEYESHDGLDEEERERREYKGSWAYMNEQYDQQDYPSDFDWENVGSSDSSVESEAHAHECDEARGPGDGSTYPLFEPGNFAIDYPAEFIPGILCKKRIGPEQLKLPCELIDQIVGELDCEYHEPHRRVVRAVWDHDNQVWTYRTFHPPNQIPYEYSHGGESARDQLDEKLMPAPTLGPLQPYQYFNYEHDILVLEYNRCGSSPEDREEYWHAIKTAAKELRRSVKERPYETPLTLHVPYCTYKSILNVLNQFSKLRTLEVVRLTLHDHCRDNDRDIAYIEAQDRDGVTRPSSVSYELEIVDSYEHILQSSTDWVEWEDVELYNPDERKIS